jgi:hypothetical protein
MHKSPFDFLVTWQPNRPSNSAQTEISERRGTLFKTDIPGAKIAAAIIGKEAFFEPLMSTLPESLTGPWILNMSIICFPLKRHNQCNTRVFLFQGHKKIFL